MERLAEPYPADLRQRAVRMAREHAGRRATAWAATRSIAGKAGRTRETLRLWVR